MTNLYTVETVLGRNSRAAQHDVGRIVRMSAVQPTETLVGANSAWLLGQGTIPFEAETSDEGFGTSVVVHGSSFNGVIDATANAEFSGHADDQYAILDGVITDNNDANLFLTAAFTTEWASVGRNCPQQYLQADGPLLNAIAALAGTPVLTANVLYRASRWQSHIGLTMFAESEDEDSVSDILYRAMTSTNSALLPNGTRIAQCAYAAVGPEATIWVPSSDIGTAIPSSVANNTADIFRNNPSVFYTPKGAASLNGTVVRAFGGSITEQNIWQPLGIYQHTTAQTYSNWLFCIDGNTEVVRISHGGLDLRRPRDIWSRVISPAMSASSGGNNRLPTYFGTQRIGTISKLQYLDYARYLGPVGNVLQTNVLPLV